MAVSIIMMMTDTTFAKSAPAESDTTLASGPRAYNNWGAFCVAKNHTSAAAKSWRSATRLDAKCTAPICVRSPNFRINGDKTGDDRREQLPCIALVGLLMSP